MGWPTGIAVYFVSWWLCLFMVLPWGVASPTRPLDGAMPGAPAEPRLKQKFLVTSLFAAAVWLGIYLLVNSHLIGFRAGAVQMMRQDAGS